MSRPVAGPLRRGLAATVTLAVASMTLTACFEESSPHDAVRDFLVGWQSEDYDLAAGRTDGDRATVRKALRTPRRNSTRPRSDSRSKASAGPATSRRPTSAPRSTWGRTTPSGATTAYSRCTW